MVLTGIDAETAGHTMGLISDDTQSFAVFAWVLVKGRDKRSSGGVRAARSSAAYA